MNRLSALFQFILGFLLGVFLLAGGTTALAFVFLSRMSSAPPKPLFAEEKQEKTSTTAQPVNSTPSSKQPAEAQAKPEEKTAPETPTPEAAPQEKQEVLPAGAYKARVNWSSGLSLRAEAGADAERIGGVAYNTNLIVLEESADKRWQKVRIPGSNREGWIKAGNIDKVEAGQSRE
jgi:hypothetical protein